MFSFWSFFTSQMLNRHSSFYRINAFCWLLLLRLISGPKGLFKTLCLMFSHHIQSMMWPQGRRWDKARIGRRTTRLNRLNWLRGDFLAFSCLLTLHLERTSQRNLKLISNSYFPGNLNLKILHQWSIFNSRFTKEIQTFQLHYILRQLGKISSIPQRRSRRRDE